jgi:hypothetical protein
VEVMTFRTSPTRAYEPARDLNASPPAPSPPWEQVPVREPARESTMAATSNVNTSHGADLDGLQEGFIPSSPASFVNKISKPTRHTVAHSPSVKRARPRPIATMSQRSSSYVKKARSHTPAVAAAQNVVMKKLGISQVAQLQMADLYPVLQGRAHGGASGDDKRVFLRSATHRGRCRRQ